MSDVSQPFTDDWHVTYRCRECDYEWTVTGYGDGTDDPEVMAGDDECAHCATKGEFWGSKRV